MSVQELAATRPGARTRDFAHRCITWLLDIVGSSVLLLVTAPLILVIAILIRLDSPGPVVFRHKRVGINQRRNQISVDRERRSTKGFGKPFTLYKFRTMHHDSKQRFPELYSYQFTEDALSTLPIKILVGTKPQRGSTSHRSTLGAEGSPDPRLTRVGRWLRRTSLDELPNLWNVLTGDMHLIGPRPDIEENIGQYLPQHLRILDVKPGITGLAQVRGRGHLTFHQTNELDLEYVETRSLWLDLKILLRTIVVVPKGDGAY